MNHDFTGRKVFVTGASSGIGYAAALEFARCGADVAASYNENQAGAEDLRRKVCALGRKAVVVQADVVREKDVEAMFDKVLAEFDGRLDVLVNNAGSIVKRIPIAECSTELWEQIIDLNLRSVFLCCRRVAKLMQAQKRGRVINVTSISARNGGGVGATPYASAKGGVSTFTRGFAKEMAPHGVTVNAIAPGVIDTPFHQKHTPRPVWQQQTAAIPLGPGKPEDCTGAILFLASDAAHYLTGEVIEVNGGMLMD
jgi:3-oxoacyl-[acyl-carrier protein] reductase